jgi:hypothetical protein
MASRSAGEIEDAGRRGPRVPTCDQVERMYECECVRDHPQNQGFDNFSP